MYGVTCVRRDEERERERERERKRERKLQPPKLRQQTTTLDPHHTKAKDERIHEYSKIQKNCHNEKVPCHVLVLNRNQPPAPFIPVAYFKIKSVQWSKRG